jgi:hypothetical protein
MNGPASSYNCEGNMANASKATKETREAEFAALAGQKKNSLVSELWGLMAANKKWWLGPIVILLLFFGVLVVLAGTSAAPFIYTLF